MKRLMLAAAVLSLLLPGRASADEFTATNMCQGKVVWAEVQGGVASEIIPYGESDDFSVVFDAGASADATVLVVFVSADAQNPDGGRYKAGSVRVENSMRSHWALVFEPDGGTCKPRLVGRAVQQ